MKKKLVHSHEKNQGATFEIKSNKKKKIKCKGDEIMKEKKLK